jgi:DNA-binding MarR family transcriptional regulator
MLRRHEYTAWAGFLYVHATLVRRLDLALQAAHQLQLSDYEALLFLSLAPDQQLRMSDLARSVVLSQSGISHLVARLERDGLVIRQRAAEDGRGSNACLTERGKEKLAAAHQTHLDGVRQEFLSHFGPEELEHLIGYWERLVPGVYQVVRQKM